MTKTIKNIQEVMKQQFDDMHELRAEIERLYNSDNPEDQKLAMKLASIMHNISGKTHKMYEILKDAA